MLVTNSKGIFPKILKFCSESLSNCKTNSAKLLRTYSTAVQTKTDNNTEDLIRVLSVKSSEDDMLTVKVGLSECYQFPYVWLRDNCQCTNCFHKGSKSRILDWEKFDVRVKPNAFEIRQESREIHINWEDGHKSIYELKWLKDRNFSENNRRRILSTLYKYPKIRWNADEFTKIFRSFQYRDVMNEDKILLNWLTALSQYGVALIEGAPITETECRNLSDRINFMRRTHYGKEFSVRARDMDSANNVAYLSTPLQLHTDLPYYDHVPGVILLHCQEQSSGSGGENLLADCFWAAEELRREHEPHFKRLCDTVVNWMDIGQEAGKKFHKIHRAPVICKDHDGDVSRINHSVPQRDSFFCVPLEMVSGWYKAMDVFLKLIREQTVSLKTKPGDILTIDNTRLMHGRTGYTDTTGNTRYLVGAYIDWDEIYSRIRVLQTDTKQ